MDAAAIAALGDPQRRAVYEHVAATGTPISRQQVAEALSIGKNLAGHHLDRLAEAGLLEAFFARVNGRSGPGAGRPAKLYRRTATAHELSLPPRDYRTLAAVFADAIEEAGAEPALFAAAQRHGEQLSGEPLKVLRELGYEPYADGDVWRLRNCPFDGVARSHAALVCGANLALLRGALGADVRLEPGPEGCCVVVGRGTTGTISNVDVF